MLRSFLAQRCGRLKLRTATSANLPRRRGIIARSDSPSKPSSPYNLHTEASPEAGPSTIPLFANQLSVDTVPTPLPSALQTTPLSQHAAFPSSGTSEQLILLDVCLATGNIARAKKIYRSLRAMYDDENKYTLAPDEAPSSARVHSYSRRRLRLADIIPVAVHTGFLRGIFRQALVHSQGGSTNKQARKRRYVSEAWEWFEMLLSDEDTHGQLDNAAWAVMFKGLVATQSVNPPAGLVDPAAPHLRSIARLYDLSVLHHRSLLHILSEPIFSLNSLASLNDHSGVEVAEELASSLASAGNTDALARVESIRIRLLDGDQFEDRQYRPSVETTAPPEPRIPPPPLQPARRSLEEAVPQQLDALVGNLNSIHGQHATTTDPYIRQEQLEESAYDAARWQRLYDMDVLGKLGLATEVNLKSDTLQKYMASWLPKLRKHLEDSIAMTASEVALSEKEEREMVDKRKVLSAGMLTEQADDDAAIRSLLRLLDANKLAFMTIVEMLRTVGDMSLAAGGVRATRAIVELGRHVEDQFGAEAWKILYPDVYEATIQAARTIKGNAARTYKAQKIRQFMQGQGIEAGAVNAAQRQGYGDTVAVEMDAGMSHAERQTRRQVSNKALPWSQRMRAKVGGFLIKALFEVATVERTATLPSGKIVTEQQPAFYQTFQYVMGKKVGVIKANEKIADRLDKEAVGAAFFPRYLPMLVPPLPWTNWNRGGYRVHPADVMRVRDSPEQSAYLRHASQQGYLSSVFSALDVLGRTPWRINRAIYDIVTTVWNSGEALADIPVDLAETVIPDPEIPEGTDLKDPSWRECRRIELRTVKRLRQKSHSQRCNTNYKLEIARAFLGETFYFPHNLDFRGRAYPIPPNLSHIGDDLSRGLLEFGQGRPLGKRGLRWLRIQIANTAGFDKASFDDREAFAIERMAEVEDSADHPLDGRQWWLKADDPWQCLATCIDLTAAIRSGDPESYVSYLPIQQDGTCNGLQHYAALGGDQFGAEQVNLAKGSKPGDVYTAVANLVNAELQKDLESGNPAEKEVAQLLQGKVTRKVVKQTVMTTVYGVTMIGAKNQIERQLRDRGDIPEMHIFTCGKYLALKVLSGIGDLFRGASAIQLWLSICARLIGKSITLEGLDLGEEAPAKDGNARQASPLVEKRKKRSRLGYIGAKPTLSDAFKEPMASVIWTTPLGIPVAQPYRKEKKAQVDTAFQSVFISDPNTPTPVDSRAQGSAFPPNYVHSLDATHMMLTALECDRRGLIFASVHDSYWTHACDVDSMAEALRDCFIQLHSQDLLESLLRDFKHRYADYYVRQGGVFDAALRMARSRQSPSDREAAAETAAAEVNAATDLAGLARELGPSRLPPLVAATQKDVLKTASDAAYASGKASARRTASASDPSEEDAAFMDGDDMRDEDVEDDDDDQPSSHIEADGVALSDDVNSLIDKRERATPSNKKAGSRKSTGSSHVNLPPEIKIGRQRLYRLADVFPPVPPRGDFDLNKIRESPYFFS